MGFSEKVLKSIFAKAFLKIPIRGSKTFTLKLLDVTKNYFGDIFLEIKAAFNNILSECIIAALQEMYLVQAVVKLVQSLLGNRVIFVKMGR